MSLDFFFFCMRLLYAYFNAYRNLHFKKKNSISDLFSSIFLFTLVKLYLNIIFKLKNWKFIYITNGLYVCFWIDYDSL